MDIHKYNIPITKLTALSIDQKNCAFDHNVSLENLREILLKLKKEREDLKKQLGFKNSKCARNRKHTFNKNNKCTIGFKGNRDLFLIFKLRGEQILKIQNAITEKRKGVKDAK